MLVGVEIYIFLYIVLFSFSRAKQLIKTALLENDFLRNLEPGQMREIIDCVYPRVCVKGSFLIREGDAGNSSMWSIYRIQLTIGIFKWNITVINCNFRKSSICFCLWRIWSCEKWRSLGENGPRKSIWRAGNSL